MSDARSALTPDALAMLEAIAQSGSFAAAARQLGKVPSAVTYSVRQLEDALDVLLFDRRSRQARLTAAGHELLAEGKRLLEQIDAVAHRVKRVATGWETQLTVAVDDVIARRTVLELCAAFYAGAADGLRTAGVAGAADRPPPTRLKVRTEVLAGTWEALVSGRADLAIGIGTGGEPASGFAVDELGELAFVFAVSPSHPLAAATEPIDDAELLRHRAVAVADSAYRLAPLTVHLLPGQDVLTVASMEAKIEAQALGIGCGFVPEPLARVEIAAGRLVVKKVQRTLAPARLGYAWRRAGVRHEANPARRKADARARADLGPALAWWLERLRSPATRAALLDRHADRSAAVGRAGVPAEA